MPLIVTVSEKTESGHDYDDRIGEWHEYPTMYRKRVSTGKRFIYYRGSRKADNRRQMPVYFGTGVVGAIEPARKEGRLRFYVLDYRPFNEPLPFRDASGAYLERGGQRGYWEQGVREVTDEEFGRILSAASLEPTAFDEAPVADVQPGRYASPETSLAVDAYAMRIALEEAQRMYPQHRIVRMSHSNPGHDISVMDAAGIHRYIEVKGTQAATPRFFMSEGERQFSERYRDLYTLLVIYGIDLDSQSHRVWRSDGALSLADFDLVPVQWYAEISMPSSE